jgi:transcriptional regulator with PAS, ATPase and Fis domain
VAKATLACIITGESGSGKERVARYVHENSGRNGMFVAVNCAAIPESLAESELFGYRRGAFTGADVDRPGAFQQAHRGTLLLDEIADLSLPVQAKLLRALEEGAVRPLGASKLVDVDVRVLAASPTSLERLVDEGRFRGDLYARLDGVTLRVPPLRERQEEILPLFSRAFAARAGGGPRLCPEAAEALLVYSWPFNVRELNQVAHRMAVLHGHLPRLTREHLPDQLVRQVLHNPRADAHQSPADAQREQLRCLDQALMQNDGNLSRAAKALGISRGRAYRLLNAARDPGT